MVKIRLRRMGAKKKPFYRIVVADSKSPRDGRCIEEIGTYNPLASPSEISVDMERAQYWIKNGAQPTDTVRALLKKASAQVDISKSGETKGETTADGASVDATDSVADNVDAAKDTEAVAETETETVAEVVAKAGDDGETEETEEADEDSEDEAE